MAEVADLTTVQRELANTRAALTEAVTSMRRRNRLFVFLSVLSIVLLVVYLGYAGMRFGTDLTPDLVAANVQSNFQAALPGAKDQLTKKLQADAPTLVNNAFDRMQALPTNYADQVQSAATAHMDAAMPGVQDQLYTAMKQGLDQSVKASGGDTNAKQTDEARLQATLAAVAEVYATETLRFVNQQHATYVADADQFTSYLSHLANDPNLDRAEQLHRDMFRSIFALVRDRTSTASPAGGPTLGQ